ncbi:MAG: Glu-tRNA(Gln) amidotransferase subunit GatD [Candidatus Poseidoniaceae archaeon]|jgi:glutamyl-tRNA(Gln) amidotransferase subunit D|nr:Glu-tRNA(Gln) amidotransferase subunit GatD [Candidatus Poseidoniaceae archaeon]
MVEMPEVGLKVRIEVESHNGSTNFEGIVLHPASKGHLTLKLVNGYNASYLLEEIANLEILDSKSTEEQQISEQQDIEYNSDLPRIRILHTGGTIASKVDYKTGAVVARFEPHELVASVPELAEIANIEAEKLGNMFSDDIRCQHWNKMIEASKKAFDDGCDGVVITHGTDTLHITSAALNFAWAGKGQAPPGPIALVGSQRSSDRGSSDAAENLIAAVYWAANAPKPCGIAGDSTVVVMHSSSNDGRCSIHPGIGVRKLHSTRRDAFKPVNSQPLAFINANSGDLSLELTSDYETLLNENNREICSSPTKYSSTVRIIQFMAGPWLHEEEIEAVVLTSPQAIVIHGTGLGHLPIDDPGKDAPENTKVWRALTRCINRNIPIIITTQCINGPIDMNVYSKGRKQIEMGMLGHGSVSSPDTVIVKTHWALSNDMDLNKAMESNLCGENNISLIE